MDGFPTRAVPNPIRQKLVVDRAGILEIQSDELVPGKIANVIVFLEPSDPPVRPLCELIGRGRGLFASPRDADEFIQKERDAWDW